MTPLSLSLSPPSPSPSPLPLSLFFSFAVLKSDYSNGLFGFSSILPISSEEGNNVTILVTRGRGLSSEVTVSWAVSMVGGESAANDFKPTSGDLTFTENQTQEVNIETKQL